eukprot:Lankesteria_metandrocarpae@DN2323_c0_g1_i1.p1
MAANKFTVFCFIFYFILLAELTATPVGKNTPVNKNVHRSRTLSKLCRMSRKQTAPVAAHQLINDLDQLDGGLVIWRGGYVKSLRAFYETFRWPFAGTEVLLKYYRDGIVEGQMLRATKHPTTGGFGCIEILNFNSSEQHIYYVHKELARGLFLVGENLDFMTTMTEDEDGPNFGEFKLDRVLLLDAAGVAASPPVTEINEENVLYSLQYFYGDVQWPFTVDEKLFLYRPMVTLDEASKCPVITSNALYVVVATHSDDLSLSFKILTAETIHALKWDYLCITRAIAQNLWLLKPNMRRGAEGRLIEVSSQALQEAANDYNMLRADPRAFAW